MSYNVYKEVSRMHHDKDDYLWIAKFLVKVVLAILIFVGIFTLIPAACEDETTARRVLEDNGYKDIQLTGYKWLSCDEKDTFSTGFTAISPSGKKVSGAVCSGFFKGNTIRFD